MRKPENPPTLRTFDPLEFKKLFDWEQQDTLRKYTTHKGEYLHWDELRCKKPRPDNLSAEDWWLLTKLGRIPQKLPFKDIKGKPFSFVIPTILLPKLAAIDRKCGGLISNKSTDHQERYIVNSLIEESISSSQLEGASTTRRIAKNMLLSQRKPRDNSEWMIFNNYRAMQLIRDHQEQPLSVKFILEIHCALTENLLEDAGHLRTTNDVHVEDERGDILHIPPKASELKKRLAALCDFANQDETEEQHYFHPVIKAILLHFALAYDHPFSDGNGRTARALFYWFLLNRGYWLIEYISISHIIKKAPAQYGRAFLYTETDDNDATYFIFHQIKVIQQAIEHLHTYLDTQKQEIQQVDQLLHHSNTLNHRQLLLIQHALKNPTTHYLIEHHRGSHNITYQTARTDLLGLEQLKLLLKKRVSKAFVFAAPADLKKRIAQLSTPK